VGRCRHSIISKSKITVIVDTKATIQGWIKTSLPTAFEILEKGQALLAEAG
jgi:hypothetical protein